MKSLHKKKDEKENMKLQNQLNLQSPKESDIIFHILKRTQKVWSACF